ncbi:MAG: hypothetical protein ABEJ60_05300 [Halodesulfurarchaeum sp.]
MDRRKFLAAGGAALAGSIAGCSTPSGRKSVAGIAAPAVPTSLLQQEGWEKVDELSQKVFSTEILGLYSVTGYSHTLIYEDARLRRKLHQGTLGAFDATVMSFFATHVEMNPDIDELPIGRAKVISQTKKQATDRLVQRMNAQGLRNVHRVGTRTLTVDTGQQADVTEYLAQYHFPSMTVPLRDGRSITIESGTIDVRGMLAIWQNDRFIVVSGGAYPAENFREQIRKKLTDLVSVSITIDLELEPRNYKQELENLVTAVK